MPFERVNTKYMNDILHLNIIHLYFANFIRHSSRTMEELKEILTDELCTRFCVPHLNLRDQSKLNPSCNIEGRHTHYNVFDFQTLEYVWDET